MVASLPHTLFTRSPSCDGAQVPESPRRSILGPAQAPGSFKRRLETATCLYVAYDIYFLMALGDKPLVWLHGEVKTPPFSAAARVEAGVLLRQVQGGHMLTLPQSRPMPAIGPHCHELRVRDADTTWRLVYRWTGTRS